MNPPGAQTRQSGRRGAGREAGRPAPAGRAGRSAARLRRVIVTVTVGLHFALRPAMAETNAPGLRDIKPPVDIPNPWRWLALALAAGALAALGYALTRWWRRRRETAAVVPPLPPHVRARQRLQAALTLLPQPKPFCIEVSETLRVYLEERFALRAPERTTEEFLVELQFTDRLTPAQKERLADFLQRCDLVKFAGHEPREPELRDLHQAAWRLVEETEPLPGLADSSALGASDTSAPPSAAGRAVVAAAAPRNRAS